MLEKRGLNKIFSLLLILLIIISISSIVIAETIEEPTPSEPPTTTPEELPTPDSTDTKTDTPTPPTSDDPLATPPAPQKTKDELKEEAKKNLQESKGALKTLWETVTNWAGIKVKVITEPVGEGLSRLVGANYEERSEKWEEYAKTGALAFLWIIIGYLLMKLGFVIKTIRTRGGSISEKLKEIKKTWEDEYTSKGWLDTLSGGKFKWIKRIGLILVLIFLYPVLMQMPIINKIIEIITFEVLGLSWFLRSFIVAFYIGFGPEMISKYRAYSRRVWIAKQGYEEQAGLEIAKALAKS